MPSRLQMNEVPAFITNTLPHGLGRAPIARVLR